MTMEMNFVIRYLKNLFTSSLTYTYGFKLLRRINVVPGKRMNYLEFPQNHYIYDLEPSTVVYF